MPAGQFSDSTKSDASLPRLHAQAISPGLSSAYSRSAGNMIAAQDPSGSFVRLNRSVRHFGASRVFVLLDCFDADLQDHAGLGFSPEGSVEAHRERARKARGREPEFPQDVSF